MKQTQTIQGEQIRRERRKECKTTKPSEEERRNCSNERPPGKIAGGLTCAKGGHRIKNKNNEIIMGKKRKSLEKLKSKEERRKKEYFPKVKKRGGKKTITIYIF